VLVVEDERAVRHLVRTILTRAGYTVHDAEGPDAAEAFLGRHEEPLDLLIADIRLPGASGPELFERARARRPTLRVLYMSGYSDEAIRKEPLIEAGAAFIRKPFTADLLSQKVREVLQT
jgi:two-component system, cell cycle sensor histidine kinase and response regulator CckA